MDGIDSCGELEQQEVSWGGIVEEDQGSNNHPAEDVS